VTTATKITIARFAFVPPLVVAICGATWWPEHAGLARIVALALFAGAAFTDFLDGYVARRFAQCSRLGAALDPLIDKVLLGAAIWTIWACPSVYGPVPLWYPLVVALNDSVLGLGFLAVRHRINPDEFKAMIWGKVATVGQIGVVLWLLIGLAHGEILVAIAAAATAASGIAYVFRAQRLMARTTPQTQDP